MNQCTGVYPAQQLSSMRAMGFNYVNMLDFPTQEPILAAADRIGIFLGPVIKQDADLIFKKHAAFPGLTRLDGKTIPEDEFARFRKQFTDLSEYYATHPSVLAYVRMFNWLCDCELAYNPHLAGRREHSSDERPLSPTGFWRRPAQSIRPGSTIFTMRAGADRFTPITVTGIARFHCRRKPIFPSCGRLTALRTRCPFS